MATHKIVIAKDGTMKFIHSDALQFLIDQAATLKITRASHVEPTDDGLWVADMSPVGGPQSPPFRLRQEALDWEAAWLNTHVIV